MNKSRLNIQFIFSELSKLNSLHTENNSFYSAVTRVSTFPIRFCSRASLLTWTHIRPIFFWNSQSPPTHSLLTPSPPPTHTHTHTLLFSTYNSAAPEFLRESWYRGGCTIGDKTSWLTEQSNPILRLYCPQQTKPMYVYIRMKFY